MVGLADRRERWVGVLHEQAVVEGDEREVVRHGQPGSPRGPERGQGQDIGGGDDRGGRLG